MLESVLTSLESGFATPVAAGLRNHSSAWRGYISISFITMTSQHHPLLSYYDCMAAHHLSPAPLRIRPSIILAPLITSPSDGHRLWCAVTGYQGDEPRYVRVLQRTNSRVTHVATLTPTEISWKVTADVFVKLTRMMMRIADTPEVAMTLAQLGMRLNRTGTMASAPWSNLFPNTNERWLQEYTGSNTPKNMLVTQSATKMNQPLSVVWSKVLKCLKTLCSHFVICCISSIVSDSH